MRRAVTNTTLLALVASLLVWHSRGPASVDAAADELRDEESSLATPSIDDAVAIDVLPVETDTADSPPADTTSTQHVTAESERDSIDGVAIDPVVIDPVVIDPVAIDTVAIDTGARDSPPTEMPAVEEEEAGLLSAPAGAAGADDAGDLEGQSAPSGMEPAPGGASPHDPVDDASVDQAAAASGPSPAATGIAIDTLTPEALGTVEPGVPLAEAVDKSEEKPAESLKILHGQVPPGTYQRLSWSATELFEGVPVSTPVLVINGKMPGPTLCLTAAVHGDELNGIEMVRRVMHSVDPDQLSGAIIGVPIVNVQGFRRGSRYLPDRRDLNRYFPGTPEGSQASRIAYSFFTEVVTHCDALVDLHTGSFERANLPQLRADLRNPDVVTLTQGFGSTVILHDAPLEGTLRYAATNAGIPTVTLEAGGPSELELKEVMHGVKGIETLLNTLGMVKKRRLWGDPEPVYYRSSWVRANSGGILLSDVSLGSTVERGDLLGTITDPMSNDSSNLYSPYTGRVIGIARNQVVMPGFAAFHIGIQTVEASEVDFQGEEDQALQNEGDMTNQDYIDGMSE